MRANRPASCGFFRPAAAMMAAWLWFGGFATGQTPASAPRQDPAVAAGTPQSSQPMVLDRVIAIVNGDVLLESDVQEELAMAAIQPAGALWVVYPKGRQDIKEGDVMAAAKAAGLVDVKVCAFSATHTATKMVIPVARR